MTTIRAALANSRYASLLGPQSGVVAPGTPTKRRAPRGTGDVAQAKAATLATMLPVEPIIFWAWGIPKAQPRPRAFAFHGHARAYDAGTAEGWKGAIALAAANYIPAVPIDGPVSATLRFYFPRPKTLMRKKDPDGPIRHTSKPDRDNCEKAVLDCLTALRFWGDDSQVCAGPVEKWYVAKGGSPGVRIEIERLNT